MTLVIRKASQDDLEAFGERRHKPTVKAWCGELDGKIIGVGGFYFHKGRWVAFCDLKEEAKPHAITFILVAKDAMREMKKAGHRFIYAESDPLFPASRRWIERLGFRQQPSGIHRWQQ